MYGRLDTDKAALWGKCFLGHKGTFCCNTARGQRAKLETRLSSTTASRLNNTFMLQICCNKSLKYSKHCLNYECDACLPLYGLHSAEDEAFEKEEECVE